MKTITTLLMGLIMACSPLLAQKPGVVVSDKPGWHKIGQITANHKMETESITVMGADMFKSIKLMIKDAPLNIEMLKVNYEDGTSDEITVRSNIKTGGETRTIDVKMKDIKNVTFTHKSGEPGDKSEVELWGLK